MFFALYSQIFRQEFLQARKKFHSTASTSDNISVAILLFTMRFILLDSQAKDEKYFSHLPVTRTTFPP